MLRDHKADKAKAEGLTQTSTRRSSITCRRDRIVLSHSRREQCKYVDERMSVLRRPGYYMPAEDTPVALTTFYE